MTRHREEIDDIIDRVAAAITFVPADPAFAARIIDRLDDGKAAGVAWPRWAAATALLAIVIAGAIAISRDDAPQEVLVSAPPVERPASRVVPQPAPPAVTARGDADAPRQARRVPLPPRSSEVIGVPQIAALPSPEALDLSNLSTDLLTIAPVDVAPLDLANLAVAELVGRDDFKE